MFDVITFGSAISDTFLRLKKEDSHVLAGKHFHSGEGLCLSFGSKVFIEQMEIFSGGGGTNTACTFAKQGLKTAYVGKVGDDKAGKEIIDELKKLSVSTSFLQKDKQRKTALSIILSSPSGERTILVYQGACHFMTEDDIPWGKVKKTKWFYLAPLSGESSKVFAPLVNFAKMAKIKIASNPGSSQLALKENVLKSVLSKVDVLILNKEEASLLAGISGEDEALMKGLKRFGSRIVVVTKGRDGSVVCDDTYLYKAGVLETSVVEKTGAGDAFASGFLTGLLQKNDISFAMQLATANATSCIQQVGSKNGLLKKGDFGPWPRVAISKSHYE